MTYVWVLVIYVSLSSSGGPAVIDNIATKEECVRLQRAVDVDGLRVKSRCYQVGKVRP